MESISALFILLIALFLVILLICWIVLPFIVMGTNTRLDKILKELRAIRINNTDIDNPPIESDDSEHAYFPDKKKNGSERSDSLKIPENKKAFNTKKKSK